VVQAKIKVEESAPGVVEESALILKLADNFIYIVINGHRTNILLLCSLQDCKQSLASCQCTYFHFLILVERILRVKFISGVFEHPFSDQSLLDIVGCKVTCFWFLSNFCVSFCLSHLKIDVTNDRQYVDLSGTLITRA